MIRHNIRSALLGTCAVAALALGAPHGARAQVTQVYGGGSTLAAKIYGQVFTNVETILDPTVNWNYAAVGSGAGARAVLCNDGSQVPNGGVNAPVVHYGASDNPLTSAQITAWNTNAAQGGGCAVQNGGIALDGPLLQIPTIGTPITITFNNANETANGILTFNDAQLCGIFSGAITSWTDSRLSTIGGGRHPPTGPITVIYRSDGSGTSALFTAHLNAVCPATNGPDNISFTSTQTFAQLFPGSTPPGAPANFIGASGSGGVQASIGLPAAETGGAATGHPGAIGYLSPDYTQASPSNTNSSSFSPVAALINAFTSTALLPNYTNTVAALGTAPIPGQTGGGDPTNGTQYVPTAPNPHVGYPIVGYTTWILPVCYQNNNVVNDIYEFLAQIYTTPNYISLIQAQGFVQLPAGLLGVINDNILNNNNGYNIDIDDANICQNNGVSGPGTYAGR
jgi:ABC-type phosphate transport system substrate-binding protein